MWQAVKLLFYGSNEPSTEPECMIHFNSAFRKLQAGQTEEAYQGFMYSIQMNAEYKIEQRAKPLIQLLQSMDKYTEILQLSDTLFTKNPHVLGFLISKGVALKQLQRMDECEKCFALAVELQPNNDAFYRTYCAFLVQQKRWHQLLELNKQMIEHKPLTPMYHTHYIHALEMLNQTQSAQQHMQLILEKYGATSASINFVAGDYYYKHESYAEAESCLKAAAQLDIKNERFQIYYIRALLQNGKQNAANTYCHELINKAPDNVRWINTVGYICFDAFDFESAATHFKRCIELQPSDPYHTVDYAMVLCELNALEQAERIIQSVIAKHPMFVAAHYRLARILEYKKEYALSQEIYLKIMKMNPRKPKMNMAYAHLLYLMGEYEESMKYFEIAKRIDGANPWFHFWFALLLITDHYKKYDEAVGCFEQCLKLQSTHHKCHYEYACLLYNILSGDGNKQKAIQHMKEAVQIDFKNNAYQEILKRWIEDSNEDEKKEGHQIRRLVQREYIFKSMDNDHKCMVCLDDEFKDVMFTLDALSLDEMKNISDTIKEGAAQKKDVKIVVVETHTKDNEISQKVSHAKM